MSSWLSGVSQVHANAEAELRSIGRSGIVLYAEESRERANMASSASEHISSSA